MVNMQILFRRINSPEVNEMEKVELGCTGNGKEYGSITTLIGGEVFN